MQKNMGTADRSMRIVVALVAGILYFADVIPGVLGMLLALISVIFLVTGIMGVCPLYMPFRFSTGRSAGVKSGGRAQ